VPFAVSSGRAQGKNSLLNDHPFIARRRVASSRAIMCCGWNVGACAPAKSSTGLRVIARCLVPDSRRKFAAAFTRARVEWSEFLLVASSSPCALPASRGAVASSVVDPSNPNARAWINRKNRYLRASLLSQARKSVNQPMLIFHVVCSRQAGKTHHQANAGSIRAIAGRSAAAVEVGNQLHDVESEPEMRPAAVLAGPRLP
jgi:hypothetical protein